MQILRFFLTVSVLGEHDTDELQAELINHIKELMPNANGNELRIHVCPQEAYDKDLISRHEAERRAKRPSVAEVVAHAKKVAAEKTPEQKEAAAKKNAKRKAAKANKKHLTTGQANHDGGGNQE